MVLLLKWLLYGGNNNLDPWLVKYFNGELAITTVQRDITLIQLKERVTAVCGFSSRVANFDLIWNAGHKLFSIIDEDALKSVFKICDEYTEVFVIIKL